MPVGLVPVGLVPMGAWAVVVPVGRGWSMSVVAGRVHAGVVELFWACPFRAARGPFGVWPLAGVRGGQP